MIDLHLHTTASDGALGPADLVARARAAGLTTVGVADHDTTAALPATRAAAETAGIGFVDGIEITAVDHERDVHVLGYFIDPASPSLQAFLERQRNDRVRRVSEIVGRLAALGVEIDLEPLLAKASGGRRSIGRPHVAQALIDAGYVASWEEAFERYLAPGKPAFVPRRGATPAAVVGVIHDAGGVAVLAHPGLTGIDPAIPALAAQGLDGVEVRHPEHDGLAEARYRALAVDLGLATTAGSDFHADGGRHPLALGAFTMTNAELAALEARRP